MSDACAGWNDPGTRRRRLKGIHAARARIAAGEGFIYAAEMPGVDSIKIGFSLDPAKRMTSLSVGHDTQWRLLGAIPGSIIDEKALHRNLGRGHHEHEFYPRSILYHPAIPAELRMAA